jgi:dephospho-CoA kinase
VGGIGAGKTTVASILQSLGAAVIDSDVLAHEELNDPEVRRTLCSWWGQRVCPAGDRVDRSAVAAIVFENRGELDRLEKLLYPRLHQKREELVAAYDADPAARAVVMDAPKLYEAGLGNYCDAVIFVEADKRVRAERVQGSRGWSEEELTRRESAQNSLDGKRAIADYIVTNRSNLESLRTEVERVFSLVLAKFA